MQNELSIDEEPECSVAVLQVDVQKLQGVERDPGNLVHAGTADGLETGLQSRGCARYAAQICQS